MAQARPSPIYDPVSRAKSRNRSKGGLTPSEHSQRKESSLNTYFNQRKSKLKDITRENKKIYVRINSQKSLYSSRDLEQSYERSCSHSRRLSQSRLSRVSTSSRGSSMGRQQTKKNNPVRKSIKVESKSIKNIQCNEVHRYLNIFCNNSQPRKTNLTPKPSPSQQLPSSNPFDKENVHKKPPALEKIVEELTNKKHNAQTMVLRRLL